MRSRSMATRHRNNGSGPGEAFIANTSVRENCSADRVSVHREVDRAYHDPGGSAALLLAKENASATWHGQHSLTGLPMVRYESIQCISPEYAQKIRDQIDGDESSLTITQILCSAGGPSRFFSTGSRLAAFKSHNCHLWHCSIDRKR